MGCPGELKILAVAGPQNCNYTKWFQQQDRREYSSRRFFEWIFNGLTVASLSLFGPPYTDSIAKCERPINMENPIKKVTGILSIVMPHAFPLAADIQLYLDTRRCSPYFPKTMLQEWEGVLEDATGLYLDPLDHPGEGKFVSAGLGLADPSCWLYWPQSRYK